jgi:hypothetical protein
MKRPEWYNNRQQQRTGENKMEITESTTKCTMTLITPEIASKMLSTENYVGQRTISLRTVNYLADQMVKGLFKTSLISLAVTPERRHMLNGQHTESAIIKTGIPQWVILQETQCQDMKEVAALFATIDRQKTRDQATIYHAYGLAEKLNFSRTATGQFTTAINFLIIDLIKSIPDRKPSPQEIIDFAEKTAWRYGSFLEATKEINSAKSGKNRSSLIALALSTASHHRSYDFWNGFASDDGLRKSDPRKVYLDFCWHTSLSLNSTTTKRKTSPIMTFMVGAYCWNKYVRNQDIKTLQMDKVQDTKVLLDTCFHTGFTKENLIKMTGE